MSDSIKKIEDVFEGMARRKNDSVFLLRKDLPDLKGKDGETPTDEHLIDLIKPLIPNPIPGQAGKDYVLTEQDKEEIATLAQMDIEVPVVEKVIERTEVIKEVPIVTENVVEVAKYETPDEIVKKVNEAKPLIKKERVEGLADIERIAKANAFDVRIGVSKTEVKAIENRVKTLEDNPGGGSSWGSITGTLSDQTDLQAELDAKENKAVVLGTTTIYSSGGNVTSVVTPDGTSNFTNPTATSIEIDNGDNNWVLDYSDLDEITVITT